MPGVWADHCSIAEYQQATSKRAFGCAARARRRRRACPRFSCSGMEASAPDTLRLTGEGFLILRRTIFESSLKLMQACAAASNTDLLEAGCFCVVVAKVEIPYTSQLTNQSMCGMGFSDMRTLRVWLQGCHLWGIHVGRAGRKRPLGTVVLVGTGHRHCLP